MLFEKFRQKSDLKKIRAFRGLDGWLTDREALGLFRMAAALGENATIVEIGSWQGKSTYCLTAGLKSGTVFAIDPFNGDAGNDKDSSAEYQEKMGQRDLSGIFLQNMKTLGVLGKIHMKKGYSQDFHQEFSKIHALFIDGDHSITGCTNDFHLYADKLIPGGFLAFHDYYPNRPELGPTYTIQNLVIPDPGFAFYKQYDSLWIAKKLKA
jgi:predicted O-methyltransferase YrrM